MHSIINRNIKTIRFGLRNNSTNNKDNKQNKEKGENNSQYIWSNKCHYKNRKEANTIFDRYAKRKHEVRI